MSYDQKIGVVFIETKCISSKMCFTEENRIFMSLTVVTIIPSDEWK